MSHDCMNQSTIAASSCRRGRRRRTWAMPVVTRFVARHGRQQEAAIPHQRARWLAPLPRCLSDGRRELWRNQLKAIQTHCDADRCMNGARGVTVHAEIRTLKAGTRRPGCNEDSRATTTLAVHPDRFGLVRTGRGPRARLVAPTGKPAAGCLLRTPSSGGLQAAAKGLQ